MNNKNLQRMSLFRKRLEIDRFFFLSHRVSQNLSHLEKHTLK